MEMMNRENFAKYSRRLNMRTLVIFIILTLITLMYIFLLTGCETNNTEEALDTQSEKIPIPESTHSEDTAGLFLDNPETIPVEGAGNVVIVEKTKDLPALKKEEQTGNQPEEKSVYSAKITDIAPKNVILRRGQFIPKAHAVEGVVTLYYARDKEITGTNNELLLVLEFEPDFSAAYAPELHVYLTTVYDPVDTYTFDDNEYIDLGRLKKYQGKQYYVIPESAKNIEYSNVVLYSPAFDIVYGVAALY